eukprot:TRINITY_DN21111_c0_g1_i1.p1 TRINITY_DN21111_c0_g1~~TRINITY_DN21111_c0_g1_i1.p1  ORF type:complete len:161 (-),score=18.83 TRINITY_DN21111_c0_g1_i1:229-711(-)
MQSHRADRDYFFSRCKQIFRAIDADGSGTVRTDEMGPYLDSEPARALFSALGVDVGEVYEVFELLDEDGDEVIDLDEFMFGLMQLRGGASALGMLQIQHQGKKINETLQTLADALHVQVPGNRATRAKQSVVGDDTHYFNGLAALSAFCSCTSAQRDCSA